MTALVLTITRAGYERFTAAQLGEDIDLLVTSVGLTDDVFVASPTLTALPGEHRRLLTISGQAIGDDVVHLVARDAEPVSYRVRGLGLYLGDGTLFATHASPDRIVEKATVSDLHLAIDIAFPPGTAATITFGDANFLTPPATTDSKGVVELATEAEADAGTPGALAITAALLRRAIAAMQATIDAVTGDITDAVSQALAGFAARTIYGGDLVKGGGDLTANRTLTVDAASAADVKAGTRLDAAITPAALRGATTSVLAADGYRIHPDGYIEQWGLWAGSLANETAFVVPFHIPFPNACLGCTPVVLNLIASDSGAVSAQEVSLSTTQATFFAQNEGASGANNAGIRWRAWGY